MLYRFKNIQLTVFSAVVLCFFYACSSWDEFKEYTKDGEITYTGKIDSVKVYSGKERVRVHGYLKADPKINKVKIFWNNYADSVEYDVEKKSGVKVFDKIFSVEEGIKSFIIHTYDNEGNKSVAVYAVGQSYGERYQAGLNNRLVASAALVNSNTEINWLAIDLTGGPFASEVRYISDAGEKTILVPVTEEKTVLSDVAASTKSFSYRTLYLPQKGSIDTFYTAYQNVGIYRDVTAEFLKNTQVPVATVEKGDRWGTPADWITNTAVRNFRQAPGVYYGGVDYWFGGPFLAMEAGWSTDNMNSFENGKIYQSPVLSPGIYTLEADVPDCSANGRFYMVAAEGDEIPNIENLNASLANLRTNTPGTHKITFTVNESKKISLGFVGSLTNSGNSGEFFRVTAVRLKQLPAVE